MYIFEKACFLFFCFWRMESSIEGGRGSGPGIGAVRSVRWMVGMILFTTFVKSFTAFFAWRDVLV